MSKNFSAENTNSFCLNSVDNRIDRGANVTSLSVADMFCTEREDFSL